MASGYSTNEYVDGILSGNRSVLSRAITLIESTNETHHEQAFEIIEKCLPHSGNSIRVGITGVPGVGKSTFIDALGKYLINMENKVAVLAVDPSSTKTKGSILGDKTRMENLSANENAYVRPSPSAGSLGGVTATTRETMLLCEAAGYNIILIETVGVGQSETEVANMVDFFMLLMLAGAGDELQGIKRGIMEMADAVIINKADGDNVAPANKAAQLYRNALGLFPPTALGWVPQVTTCSALENTQITDCWNLVSDYMSLANEKNGLQAKRKKQLSNWFNHAVESELKRKFFHSPEVESRLNELKTQVIEGMISPIAAARKLIT